VFAPGQSHATVDVGPLAAGVSTENQWWGPGVRNALVLSNAGEGVVHAFVRTGRPLRTRIGDVEARWIVGGLTPSLFFDQPDDTPAGRALSGAVATLRLRAEPDLTVGVARLVLTPTRGAVLGRAFDVFHRNQPLGADQALPDRRRVDQLMSVFARWVFPGAGAEAYGEFARLELPRSFREFLVAPMNTGAYTLGAARAYRPRAGHAVRANLEISNLEQSRTLTDRPPPPDYYTGRAAPGGFTNRGQVLGAAIGPGSQSQWASADYYAPAWQVGVYAQRVRHQNDALYRRFLPIFPRHDVSLAGGLRGGVRRHGVDALATIGVSDRLNYLFQNGRGNLGGVGTVDVRNVTVGLHLAPAPRAR
jgi:hypothetical protein